MPDHEMPLRSLIRGGVRAAWQRAEADGALPALPDGADAPPVELTRPQNQEHGDLATNLAMKLARPLRRPPMQIAAALVDALRAGWSMGESGPVLSADVAPPGFINLRLAPAALENALDGVRRAGAHFGRLVVPDPQSINVEFLSANPTGPLTVGNARGAFVGDLLSRVLEAAGHRVTREYYFNDTNRQIVMLGASIAAHRTNQSIPQDGYHGEYVRELAQELPEEIWGRAIEAGAERDAIIGAWAGQQVRAGIEASLAALGVRFDVWKTEGSLHTEGWVERAIDRLRDGGHIYEQDGALWFRSTAFGDDKDRVIRRSDASSTYFAADIGYVTEKFSRGFDTLIYIWGADHHGTVARNRNAAEAMGYDREAVRMLLIAWVHFIRDGQDISMSKRAGDFITLDELLAEVGVDAARWYFASRARTTGIDFDIEAAKDPTAANPVHYVRYAHARICSILRKGEDLGLRPADSLRGTLADDAAALSLAKQVLRLPEVVEDAAAAEETQGTTAYATELATALHAYYRDRRVVDPDDPGTSAARLALMDAARVSLASTLGLLGISAPESM